MTKYILVNAFIQHFIQNEEPLIVRHTSLCYLCVIAHAHSFRFRFQSDRVFTCTLNRIRKGINRPFDSIEFHSDRAQSDRLRCLQEAFSVRLSRQSDYKRIICLHVNVASVIEDDSSGLCLG